MELRPVQKFCQGKGSSMQCPTVYETDDPGVMLIQGYELATADVPQGLPAGENIVAVPLELISWIKENLG